MEQVTQNKVMKAGDEQFQALSKKVNLNQAGYSHMINPLKLTVMVAELSTEYSIPVEEAKEFVKALLAEAFDRANGTLDLPNLPEIVREWQTPEGKKRAEFLAEQK